MYTNNKILVDSSVFIEALKGNNKTFYKKLVSDNESQFFINEIILSEYLYYVLGINGGLSPRTIKEKKQIASVLASCNDQIVILSDFVILPSLNLLASIVPVLMSTYNLLPNDAIIMATCKIHGIAKLASHDKDFIAPCAGEGIELLRDEKIE